MQLTREEKIPVIQGMTGIQNKFSSAFDYSTTNQV